jgi:hypothetical protein
MTISNIMEPQPAGKKRGGLPLWLVLEYLVEDWRKKEQEGKAPMRITEVFNQVCVDGQAAAGYHSELMSWEVADLIEMDLEQINSLEKAYRKTRRYTTRRGLLRSTNLLDFLRDL